MSISFEIKKLINCPYCKAEKYIVFRHNDDPMEIIYCDEEECGKPFVLSRTFELSIYPNIKKIEGYDI